MIYFAIATLLGIPAFCLVWWNKKIADSALGTWLFCFSFFVSPICGIITLCLLGQVWLVVFLGIVTAFVIDIIENPTPYVTVVVLFLVLSFAMWLIYVVTGLTLEDAERLVAPMVERALGS